MPIFAVVFDNTVRELREYHEQPSCKVVGGLPTIRPFVEKDPSPSQKRGGYVIFPDRVEREILSKDATDIESDKLAEIDDIEVKTVRLFFDLCKALVAAGVLNINDPNLARIKTAYLRWKQLTGN